MKAKVGAREVIHCTSLIIPSSESAEICFNVGAWEIDIKISFETDSTKEGSRDILYDNIDNQLHLKFRNWTNSIGTALIKPVEIGRTNTNQGLSFIATHWLIGDVNKIDMQFMLDAIN
jgi:hypothetical protein